MHLAAIRIAAHCNIIIVLVHKICAWQRSHCVSHHRACSAKTKSCAQYQLLAEVVTMQSLKAK